MSTANVNASNFLLQYVKKRTNSPELNLKNQFPESKKYCSDTLSSSLNTKNEQSQTTASRPITLAKQINPRVQKQCLINIPLVPSQDFSAKNISSNDRTSFNGFGGQKTHQFSNTTNTHTSMITKKSENENTNLYILDENSSDSEDNKSVIYVDSEDDYYHPEKPTSTTMNKMMCSVKVQTMNEDEVLRNKKIQCTCGRFTQFLTGVRSRAVQTDPERYCRF